VNFLLGSTHKSSLYSFSLSAYGPPEYILVVDVSEIFHDISPGYLSVLMSIRRLIHISVGLAVGDEVAVGGEVIVGGDVGDDVGDEIGANV